MDQDADGFAFLVVVGIIVVIVTLYIALRVLSLVLALITRALCELVNTGDLLFVGLLGVCIEAIRLVIGFGSLFAGVCTCLFRYDIVRKRLAAAEAAWKMETGLSPFQSLPNWCKRGSPSIADFSTQVQSVSTPMRYPVHGWPGYSYGQVCENQEYTYFLSGEYVQHESVVEAVKGRTEVVSRMKQTVDIRCHDPLSKHTVLEGKDTLPNNDDFARPIRNSGSVSENCGSDEGDRGERGTPFAQAKLKPSKKKSSKNVTTTQAQRPEFVSAAKTCQVCETQVGRRKLFVSNIAWKTSSAGLRDAFSQFGAVIEARVIVDRNTGRSRGFGIVVYTHDSSAEAAISQLGGRELDGRRIRVSYYTDEKYR